MKKILVCVDSFEVGGVTEVVKRIYHNIDRSKFQMDFVAVRKLDNDIEKEIEKNGDKIHFLTLPPLKSVPYFNYIIRDRYMVKQIIKTIKRDRYSAAHIHTHGNFYLPATNKLGIPVRIYHAHEGISDFNGNEEKSFLTAQLWRDRQKKYNKLSTIKAGDSLKACIAKFGSSIIKDEKMKIIYPSVDTNRFNPDNYGDGEEFDIDKNSFNMIHVGRLSAVKNQSFLIDVLEEILKTRASHLYIVGEGDDEKKKLLDYADKKGVTDKVTFLAGNTPPGIYKKMNCSLLPSFSEAFGMVAVESQLMGVPCFASTNVPEDVNVGMCSFFDLSLGAKYWAAKIFEYNYEDAKLDVEKKNRFDINNIIKTLEKIYD